MCSIYHSSQASAKRHQRTHLTDGGDLNYCMHSDDDVSETTATAAATAAATIAQPDSETVDTMPVIRNLFDWLQSAFEPTSK